MIRLYQPDNAAQLASLSRFIEDAILEEAKKDDFNLSQLLSEIDNMLGTGIQLGSAAAAELTNMFSRLRSQLAWNFTLEEAGGYLADVVSVAPRHCGKVERLRDEHNELQNELMAISDETKSSGSSELTRDEQKCLAERFFEFRRRLRDHNARERELIVDALYVDIGGPG